MSAFLSPDPQIDRGFPPRAPEISTWLAFPPPPQRAQPASIPAPPPFDQPALWTFLRCLGLESSLILPLCRGSIHCSSRYQLYLHVLLPTPSSFPKALVRPIAGIPPTNVIVYLRSHPSMSIVPLNDLLLGLLSMVCTRLVPPILWTRNGFGSRQPSSP